MLSTAPGERPPTASEPEQHLLVRLAEMLASLTLPEGIEIFHRGEDGRETCLGGKDGVQAAACTERWVPTGPLTAGAVCIRDHTAGACFCDVLAQSIRCLVEEEGAERREEAMLDELSVSWESLDALYELNSDLRQVTDSTELLQRLLDRASAVGLSLAGGPLSVALLERTRAGFFARMSCRVPELRAGDAADWLGSLGSLGETHVFNGSNQVCSLRNAPAYLKSATCLVVAPVTRSADDQLVLAAWSERARLETHAVRLMEALALHAAMIVESERLRSALIAKQRMEHDLEIGAAIQSMLLVEALPVAPRDYDAAVYAVPSQTVDGDFYDFISYPDGTLDVVVGDVMGKGVPAALVGAATKSGVLRALGISGPAPVAEVVGAVSRRLCRKLIDLERFVTLCYARLDSGRRQLTFVDCGHTGILHYRAASGDCAYLRGTNMPVGFSEGDVYEEQTAVVAPGDVLVFYSDGVTEARSPAGALYGEERLTAVVAANAHCTAAAITEAIRCDTSAFAGMEALSDDLTCVVLKIAPLHRTTLVRTDLGELDRLRAWLREFLRDPAFVAWDEEFVESMELALTEAVSNVIRHAYAGMPEAFFEVALALDGRQLCATIRHRGKPFDPDAVAQPAFDGTRSGGFGLFVVRNCVDRVQWKSTTDGFHIMTLTKFHKGEI